MAGEVADDSRTSFVGRKRDRQNSTQYREPPTLVDSSDEDSHSISSPKRVKQAHSFADVAKVDDVLANSTTSPFPVDEPGLDGSSEAYSREGVDIHTSDGPQIAVEAPDRQLEIGPVPQSDNYNDSRSTNVSEETPRDLVGAALALESSKSLTSESTEARQLSLASSSEEYMPALTAEPAIATSNFPADIRGVPVSGWNNGVQSGLRTSFGSRPILAPSKATRGDSATSTSLTVALSGDDNICLGNADASSSSPGTNHQETPMFTFGDEVSSQADRSYPKASFRMLPKFVRQKLPPDEREAYDKAKAADAEEKREQALNYKTAQADLAIAQRGKWPLPKKYSDVTRWIRTGETFYARIDRKYKGFKTHSMALDTPCGLDAKGMPIKAQDYSFNIFATAFLTSNSNKLNHLNDRNLHLAFQQYCNYYYSHLGTHLEPLLATAKANSAFTFEQAIQHAGLPPASSNNQGISGLQSLGQSHGELSNQVGKEQEDAHHTSRVLDEVESRISVEGSASHTNGLSTMKQCTTFSNQASSTMTEIADGAASGVGEGTLETASRGTRALEFSNDELELDIALQEKYFPSISPEPALLRCLACGDAGHRLRECPALYCTLCTENGKHSNFTCPSKQTCGKCRQRGHETLNCPEKLFATDPEAGCNICGSANHVEGACHFIWRSFAPQPEEIRKVCYIPVCCYTCGADGHYGPECGLHTRPLLSGGYTWSISNLQKYLDPASPNRALSAGIDYSIPKPKKEFSIKGKGRANDPFTIEDSDDDGFIRPKIDKPEQRGYIRFVERSRTENSVLNYAPTEPHTRSSYRVDNLSYNVAMDSTTLGNYVSPTGSTQNISAKGAPHESSRHFQFAGNQRGQSSGESNGNGTIRKKKKRNQGGSQPPGQAINNQNMPPPTRPKKKSAAKKRERAAAKQAR